MGYTLLHGDDPSIENLGGVFFKIRRSLGTTAFGVNEVRVPPGATGQLHDESETGHDEVYCCIAGSGTFAIEGEPVAVRQGDYLLVAPESNRQVTGGADGMTFIAIGAKPQPQYDGRSSL